MEIQIVQKARAVQTQCLPAYESSRLVLQQDGQQLHAHAGIGSVGSSGGISDNSAISGVSFLQQPDTSSQSDQLASGSGMNTLQYSNGYVSHCRDLHICYS